MCGTCGEFFLDPQRRADAERVVAKKQAIVQREPSDDGQVILGPCGLVFRRLSIIVHRWKHQPIASVDKDKLPAAIVPPAHLKRRLNLPLTCFTAGGEGAGDETAQAALVASLFGAVYRCVAIRRPPPEVLEDLVWHLEGPLGDTACPPTYLPSRAAAKEVRVVLTGEGSGQTNTSCSALLRYYLFLLQELWFRRFVG